LHDHPFRQCEIRSALKEHVFRDFEAKADALPAGCCGRHGTRGLPPHTAAEDERDVAMIVYQE
jgi:hypothetical protein